MRKEVKYIRLNLIVLKPKQVFEVEKGEIFDESLTSLEKNNIFENACFEVG